VNLLLRKRYIVAFAGVLMAAGAGWAQAPDTIFVHGNILTGTRLRAGDASDTPGRVRAVAIRAGTIVAVGGDREMLALKGEQTAVVDLGGAFAMPGFNDAHTHIASAGEQRLSLDLDHVASLAVMREKVRAYAGGRAAG
jgi:predicted amidohydrolase YtcJ